MTRLVPGGPAATAARHSSSEISFARAFSLLSRLRFTRWRNRVRQAFGRAATSSSARSGQRTARGAGDIGLVVFLVVLLSLSCAQSFAYFDALAREQGAAAVGRRAIYLSSALCMAVFLIAGAGSGGQNREATEELDWIMTLPARSWVMAAAKLGEATVLNPFGWMLLFPFLTGLGLQTGLGVAAPLVALGLCLPLFAMRAVLGPRSATRPRVSSCSPSCTRRSGSAR